MCLNMQKFPTKQVQDLQTILTKTEAELKTSSQSASLSFLGYVYKAQAALLRNTG
jgi:hypothetical protein